MRQKWIQYAKNTATPGYAIMQHNRSLANHQFEINELRRRINAIDAILESEVFEGQGGPEAQIAAREQFQFA
ncbi:hypothetical protein H257_17433 [Aphanomyces astaci]|uniref:Uncharacterized protein n=1 Tax=Aphanomyces astaci TaxID=112090 RepID=W4FGQ0_APHAT|nr:hypothetical protein H257_17433 [Aphanomyces astaci]ETV66016.1 hypothetical protein H257_17433 [Aphanomyces astaci]|eukprot:XP_009844535.1 hypothetical protein H257_17433 [Aphanomyces astaci]